jgi:hypothetical protein
MHAVSGVKPDGEGGVDVEAPQAGSSHSSIFLRVVLVLGSTALIVAAYLWWQNKHSTTSQGYLPVVQMHSMPADGYGNGMGSNRQGRNSARTSPV